MRDLTIFIIIIIAFTAYFFYSKYKSASNPYNIPSEYRGAEGLDYIRKNHASELSQARSLCTGQFKGEWRSDSSTIGCYNMEGFSSYFCGTDTIQNLVNLCNSIGGNSVCSSSQASCSV